MKKNKTAKIFLKSRISKKSQMEIMGLAIVVIIIVIGFSFMIRFLANKKPTEYKEDFSKSELVSNIINTILKTTATTTGNCKGMSFSDLLARCSEISSIECDSTLTDVCEFTKTNMETILQNTIGENKLKLDYYLVVSENLEGTTEINGNDFNMGTGQCPGSKKSNSYPVPTSTADNVYVILDICG